MSFKILNWDRYPILLWFSETKLEKSCVTCICASFCCAFNDFFSLLAHETIFLAFNWKKKHLHSLEILIRVVHKKEPAVCFIMCLQRKYYSCIPAPRRTQSFYSLYWKVETDLCNQAYLMLLFFLCFCIFLLV